MSGSNDKLANMPPDGDQLSPRVPDPVGPRESDPVGPREPDPIRAELQERMERLPPGHPSSPYNDDGSRKPPLPDLSDYELPIPGDPDYRPEPSSAPEADRPESAQTSEDVTPAPTLTRVQRGQRTERSYGKFRPMMNPRLMRKTPGMSKRPASGPTRCGPGAWPLVRKTPLMYLARHHRRNAKPPMMHRPMISTGGPPTSSPSPATPTTGPSHREPPKPKAQRTRHQEGTADRQHADDKAAADEQPHRTERPLAPQTRKTSLVVAQTAHGSGRADP